MLLDKVSDDLLICLYREGNQVAIDLLYERYNVFLFGFINQYAKISNIKYDYKEMFQELMVVFLNCIERYDEDSGCFYYFVKTAAERRLYQISSKLKRYGEISSLDTFMYSDGRETSVDFIAESTNKEYYETELYELICEKMTDSQIKIINMKIEGYSYEEISNELGISKQSVYRKINFLKNIIKDIIEKID